MKALQKRRISSFDTRSVMLFAALSLGGAGALQAQPTSTPSPQPTMADKPAAPSGSKFSSGPTSGRPGESSAAAAAFDRADSDRDGQLSMQEAAKLPAISQRFKALDTDQNGSLSRVEFSKGANS